jgi:hypothetical protein
MIYHSSIRVSHSPYMFYGTTAYAFGFREVTLTSGPRNLSTTATLAVTDAMACVQKRLLWLTHGIHDWIQTTVLIGLYMAGRVAKRATFHLAKEIQGVARIMSTIIAPSMVVAADASTPESGTPSQLLFHPKRLQTSQTLPVPQSVQDRTRTSKMATNPRRDWEATRNQMMLRARMQRERRSWTTLRKPFAPSQLRRRKLLPDTPETFQILQLPGRRTMPDLSRPEKSPGAGRFRGFDTHKGQ